MTDDRLGADGYSVHDAPPQPKALVAPERDVRSGRRIDLDRSDKGRNQRTRHRRWSRPRVIAVAGAGALAALVTGGALIAAGGSDSPGDAEATDATMTPTPTTAVPLLITTTSSTSSTTSSSTSSTSSTTTTTTVLDPDQVTHLAVLATWTRVDGDAPSGVTVGGTQEFDVPCEGGVCDLSFGWLLELGAPSMNFVTVEPSDPSSPTLCDPLTLTLVGELQDDGSYLAEFDSNPAQYEAAGCSFYGVTQTIRLVPEIG